MFEFEQSETTQGIHHPRLPGQIREQYGPQRILSFATVSWGEHCTECAFPTCYTTCSFYQARPDGRCRRFEHGIFRAEQPTTWLPYAAYLQFRNWSMLWAQGNATQLPKLLGWAIDRFGAAVWAVANPIDEVIRRWRGQRKLSLVLQSLRRRFVKLVGRTYGLFPKPDAFLLELYNPESEPMKVRLWMRANRGTHSSRFEWGADVPSGFFSREIPMTQITASIDCSRPFDMGLTVENESGKRLYVCSANFVRIRKAGAGLSMLPGERAPKKIKCLVWDLDHTLWDGILVESDASKPYPPLRDGVRSVLQELDKRGILLSIASKNSFEDAKRTLEHHGLWELFVRPQISWNRKSDALKEIAKNLNIGIDTLAIIDDQSFERDEVQNALQTVRTYDAGEVLELLGKPEFSGDRDSSGPSRRIHYQTDMKRNEDFSLSSSDYDSFLASCNIRATAKRPSADMLPRIQDIVERTNQLNTSTSRYNDAQLEALLQSPRHDCFLIECADRYGSYGYVGFLVVEKSGDKATLTDCMFSCRIQGKRIDEAIVRRLINTYAAAGFKDFHARYKRSERNAPAAAMLCQAGFEAPSREDQLLSVSKPAPLEEIKFMELEMDAVTNAQTA